MNKLFLLGAVLSALCPLALGQAQENVLYSFAGSPDGTAPVGKLVADSVGNLYGTTSAGGSTAYCEGCGTVFELFRNTDGTYTESILYEFCQQASCTDGWNPQAGLVFDASGNLYGTTLSGGGPQCYQGGGCGTVFELSPPSNSGSPWSVTQLYQFCQLPGQDTCPDGALSASKLVFDSIGNLYGTKSRGGANGVGGVVFELSPSGNGWTEAVLYSFCSEKSGGNCADGSVPMAGVTFDKSGNIYGTTESGGSNKYIGGGVVYELSKSKGAWKESVLHAFVAQNGPDGGTLLGEVDLDAAGNIYSTALQGGLDNLGVVFRLNGKGQNEQFLSFDGANGASPTTGVLIDAKSGALYGTTSGGGSGNGTVYKVAGSHEIVVLYSFDGATNGDGSNPEGALILDDKGNLYGTTKAGGVVSSDCDTGCGTVFEISR